MMADRPGRLWMIIKLRKLKNIIINVWLPVATNTRSKQVKKPLQIWRLLLVMMMCSIPWQTTLSTIMKRASGRDLPLPASVCLSAWTAWLRTSSTISWKLSGRNGLNWRWRRTEWNFPKEIKRNWYLCPCASLWLPGQKMTRKICMTCLAPMRFVRLRLFSSRTFTAISRLPLLLTCGSPVSMFRSLIRFILINRLRRAIPLFRRFPGWTVHLPGKTVVWLSILSASSPVCWRHCVHTPISAKTLSMKPAFRRQYALSGINWKCWMQWCTALITRNILLVRPVKSYNAWMKLWSLSKRQRNWNSVSCQTYCGCPKRLIFVTVVRTLPIMSWTSSIITKQYVPSCLSWPEEMRRIQTLWTHTSRKCWKMPLSPRVSKKCFQRIRMSMPKPLICSAMNIWPASVGLSCPTPR